MKVRWIRMRVDQHPRWPMPRGPRRWSDYVNCEICGCRRISYTDMSGMVNVGVWRRIKPVVPKTYQCGHPLDVDDEEEADSWSTGFVPMPNVHPRKLLFPTPVPYAVWWSIVRSTPQSYKANFAQFPLSHLWMYPELSCTVKSLWGNTEWKVTVWWNQ